jgi:hypothetical protein
MANYLDKKELLTEILNSKNKGELTPRALELLMLMVTKLSTTLKWKNPMDKQDCISTANMDLLMYWKSFNENHPKANVFAYYTQIIKMGFAKGMHVCHPEIRKDIKITNFSQQSENIYNI